MYGRRNFFVAIASINSMVQSIIWLILSIFGSLVYLCVVPVAPYVERSDFIRVTFVKLYFEGRKCIPDGSYLGKFNDDYKNPEKLNLTTPDIIFAMTTAKSIFSIAYFLVSVSFYKINKNGAQDQVLNVAMGWSILSLVVSAADALLTILLIFDALQLIRYLDAAATVTRTPDLGGIQFIPLVFALVSSRLVVLWFWNVTAALCFLINGIRSKEVFGLQELNRRRSVAEVGVDLAIPPQSSRPDSKGNEKRRSDWDLYSIEAITYFDGHGEKHLKSFSRQELCEQSAKYKNKHVWNPSGYGFTFERAEGEHDEAGDQEEAWNEGYNDSESGSSHQKIYFDFAERFKREEKTEVSKPPLGKPVSLPVPPFLPRINSYSC